ncbi:hypothetical protein AVEN_249335-1 [Araneus ventricosus]|uniref:Uncharacterized protein n=1 Tax=Araneus ventricosus TaxID=182803 RepID=A0A4Y2X8A7_ARAVE|nr:hypothetical protein AVEN_249335-1 [Araneus ventricosus]
MSHPSCSVRCQDIFISAKLIRSPRGRQDCSTTCSNISDSGYVHNRVFDLSKHHFWNKLISLSFLGTVFGNSHTLSSPQKTIENTFFFTDSISPLMLRSSKKRTPDQFRRYLPFKLAEYRHVRCVDRICTGVSFKEFTKANKPSPGSVMNHGFGKERLNSSLHLLMLSQSDHVKQLRISLKLSVDVTVHPAAVCTNIVLTYRSNLLPIHKALSLPMTSSSPSSLSSSKL